MKQVVNNQTLLRNFLNCCFDFMFGLKDTQDDENIHNKWMIYQRPVGC